MIRSQTQPQISRFKHLIILVVLCTILFPLLLNSVSEAFVPELQTRIKSFEQKSTPVDLQKWFFSPGPHWVLSHHYDEIAAGFAVKLLGETSQNTQTFIGKEIESHTGLMYFGARFYDPVIGRFISEDPLQGRIYEPLSLSRYGYAFNNPLMYIDPFGLESFRQWLGLDKPWYEAENLAARNVKEAMYDVFNFVSMGTLSRQDTLVELNEAGKISNTEYYLKTGVNAAESGVVLAASTVTGGFAGGVAVRALSVTSPLATTLVTAVVAGSTGATSAQFYSDAINVGIGVQDKFSSFESYAKTFAVGAFSGLAGVGIAKANQGLSNATGSSFFNAPPITSDSIIGRIVSPITNLEEKLFKSSFKAGVGSVDFVKSKFDFSTTFDGVFDNLNVVPKNTGPKNGARRAYLNQKFGRTGNLNVDINIRGLDNAIEKNAYQAAGLARLDRISGRITGSPQAFGTRAHKYFERSNNRLANRVAGTYRISTEQFRNAAGAIVPRRRRGSIGADVLVQHWDQNSFIRNYDLKTYSRVARPMSSARQAEFFRRFGIFADEIFIPQ